MRSKRNIVIGQSVELAKVERARQLRRQQTSEEAMLWQRLRRNQLGGLHFRRQQIIDGFIADFYCHDAALVVEVDGPIHAGQRSYDHERDRVLADRGLRVVRVTASDVRGRLDDVLRDILVAARR
jgi:very-short-patch-repair endonuclease